MHHPGHGGGAVGAQDRLGGLDLDLEPQPPPRQPVRLLQQPADQGHRLHLAHVGHLGQGDHEAVGERGLGQQAAEEQVEGPQAAPPGRRLQALDAEPRVGRGPRAGQRRGQGPGRGQGVGVLPLVRPGPVAVLEVQAEVLDRLPLQLGQHAGEDLGDQGRVEGGGLGQRRRGGGVALQRVQGPRAPRGGQLRGHLVGRDVHGVHRLPGAGVPRVAGRELGVGLGQPPVEVVQDVGAQARDRCGHRTPPLASRAAARRCRGAYVPRRGHGIAPVPRAASG